MENFLLDGERLDDLHRNNYKIIQNPKYFCFGIDAVLLSSFARASVNEVVLDLCTGNGIIPLLVHAKTNAKTLYGLEIQKELCNMAERTVKYNNLGEQIKIIEGDLKELSTFFKNSSIDVITVNPPYSNDLSGVKNSLSEKSIARHEILCTLEDVVEKSSRVLKSGGRFYMVHRPQRLVDIMYLLRKYKLEPKTIRLVQPFINKEPNMVLVEAIKCAKPMLKVLNTLIVYNQDNSFTDEVYKIYYE
ncbi:MAG: tRNA1(Val) (adenine(37)-N6)-methyltransferase [Defluviitaleaceae bacterium]|nr:tRNA1(Val) (adenine(37)-N6)-methyltransferase [Defluviitaleaceae bacterium]